MRVLVLLSNSPKKALLIKLHTEELVKELKEFLGNRQRAKAMKIALAKGNVEKKVRLCDIPITNADLILTKDAARWDLTSK